MPLRHLCIALGFLLVPAIASADGHRAGIFGGGSYLKASSLGGVHATFDVVPKDTLKNFTLIGDFAIHSGTHDEVDGTIKMFFGGVGWAFPANDTTSHVPGVHAVFGGVNGGGDTVFGTAIGGSYQYILDRSANKQLGFRVQVDGVFPKGAGDNFLRVSGGVVFRFKY